MREIPSLYLVVPCYSEEEVIEHSAQILNDSLCKWISDGIITDTSKIVFVNDGSKDRTAEILTRLCHENKKFGLLNFSRNIGHQAAILAGMLFGREYADCTITIDADLQQDIGKVPEFIEAYRKGAEVVYGVRNDRNTDGFFKKFTAGCFYKLMKFFGCDVLANSADYRLMSKKALDILSQYEESNLFLRGLIPLMGLSSDIVYFDVKDREAGQSKYTLKKMIDLATNGITSLSVKPISMITGAGIIMCIFSIIMIIFTVVEYIKGNAVAGYSTTVISIWLVGGCLMTAMGVIGEYIGKMYIETKKRPRYIIESSILGFDDTEKE